MGTISRHAGAPFADGEILTGADLEGDFSTIYDEVNGNLDDANLADDAVTTPKIVDMAVTQDKMTSGAATASEVVRATGSMAISSSFSNIGDAISHTVGNPARHVAIFVSFEVGAVSAGNVISLQMLKDGSPIADSTSDFVNYSTSANPVFCNRMFVDTAPTAGGTHTYQLRVKSVAFSYTAVSLHVFAIEPRS